MNKLYHETDGHVCLTPCPYRNEEIKIRSTTCCNCDSFVDYDGSYIHCSYPKNWNKPVELEVQFDKSRIDINGMTVYEYYKIIPEGTVTRVSSLYNISYEQVIFLDSKGQIIKNDEIRKSFERAIEKTADYSQCPRCDRTCRSQSTTLAACPACGQIFEVEKYKIDISDDPVT